VKRMNSEARELLFRVIDKRLVEAAAAKNSLSSVHPASVSAYLKSCLLYWANISTYLEGMRGMVKGFRFGEAENTQTKAMQFIWYCSRSMSEVENGVRERRGSLSRDEFDRCLQSCRHAYAAIGLVRDGLEPFRPGRKDYILNGQT